MSTDLLKKKLLETFKIEAEEHLQSIVTGLLQIEKNPTSSECIKTAEILHREAHSLKGAARAVNLLEVELICQTVEKIFSSWKKNELKPTSQQFDVLHKTFNMLKQVVSKAQNTTNVIDNKIVSETISNLNKLFQTDTPAVVSEPISEKTELNSLSSSDYSTLMQTVRISSLKLDSLLLKTEEMLSVKLIMHKYVNEFAKINESIKVWKNEWNKILHDNSSQSVNNFLNSGFDRIKELDNSLTVLRTEFAASGRQFNTLIDGLLYDAKDMVMLPFSILLGSFPTMVRNLSREQEKEINFILSGVEIKIDKRILDELKDPLIHLIRNSIDHGIEKPHERQNKNPQGTIKVRVTQFNGNEVEIIISDDGYGIDLNAVKKSAIKQGFLSQSEAQVLSDQEIISLIYLSGVSTSPIITNVSGQGLGMAIVYEKIERIGGHIEIKSQYNSGTEIKLTLPLSLTTFKGVLVRAANQMFVLPTAHLERIIRIRSEDIKTVENKDTFILDSTSISLVKLHDVLGIAKQPEKYIKQKYLPVAIIQIGNDRAAFQVDEIYGEQEILVKKLNKPLLRVKYIAAATILETGVPVPILNANDLIKAVIRDAIPLRTQLVRSDEEIIENKTILVVEDSITTRMLLKNILEMVGYTVITAVDGADAWHLLKEHAIALIVSDVEMPKMNGFELTKNVRADKKLANLPIVLVTTREAPEDREQGIEAGANAYIIKSHFDDNNLVAVIKRLIS